jgi:hypothetical protein
MTYHIRLRITLRGVQKRQKCGIQRNMLYARPGTAATLGKTQELPSPNRPRRCVEPALTTRSGNIGPTTPVRTTGGGKTLWYGSHILTVRMYGTGLFKNLEGSDLSASQVLSNEWQFVAAIIESSCSEANVRTLVPTQKVGLRSGCRTSDQLQL